MDSFDKKTRHWQLILFAILSLGFFFFITPISYIGSEPSTGGDTGSHFYPLYTLFKYGIPDLRMRVWNPGNLMGEPHLLHYFPGPYIVMCVIGLFFPLGFAFNVGTLLPLAVFPLCVFWALRKLGYKDSTSFFVGTLSILYAFNESHSMLGGNSLSLLAGQFAHMYALCFLFLFLGMVGDELKKGKKYLVPPSAFMLAGVAISHSYVLLHVPFFFLSLWFFTDYQNSKERFFHLLKTGLTGFALSAWFVIPQIGNAKWQTPTPMVWNWNDVWTEIVPYNYRPLAVLMGLTLFIVTFLMGAKKIHVKDFKLEFFFWMLPALSAVGMYFIYPKIGLVDARVVPQIQLIVAIYLGVFMGRMISMLMEKSAHIAIISLSLALLVWTHKNIKNYPYWIEWNYSSWVAKSAYPESKVIFDKIQGDFNQPRVVGEHAEKLNDTGTPRVFEMLPYFTGRGTMESLYDQASMTTPLVFHLQSLVSQASSCSLYDFSCPPLNFVNIEGKLQELGVSQLILITDEAKEKVKENPKIKLQLTSGMFSLYDLDAPVSLVEVPALKPTITKDKDFKKEFYNWFYNYDPNVPLLVYDPKDEFQMPTELNPSACHPSVDVKFNRLTLKTDCPGVPHRLKFSYHPTWKSLSGEQIFAVSPGYMMITPKGEETKLEFGHSFVWKFASLMSILTALLFFLQRSPKFNQKLKQMIAKVKSSRQ